MSMNNTSEHPDGEEGRAPLSQPIEKDDLLVQHGHEEAPEFGEADTEDPEPVANLE
ncbi:hypothetical protein ACFWHR_10860 [Leucobacter sp. NPDC058333]|uniref:hypothetical protein n=1 Tax=Leucobacter sp. NPDC058333 TaxID=3346450 RepID=UPI00364BB607